MAAVGVTEVRHEFVCVKRKLEVYAPLFAKGRMLILGDVKEV